MSPKERLLDCGCGLVSEPFWDGLKLSRNMSNMIYILFIYMFVFCIQVR